MFLVLGAGGSIGRHVSHSLRDAKAPVRALVRSRATLDAAEFAGVQLQVGDPAQRETLDAALDGVQALILVTRAHEDQMAFEQHVLLSAARARVRRIVKLSSSGTAPDAPFRVGRWHAHTEQLLRDSHLEWTIVRAHRPMQYVYSQLGSLLTQHAFYGCQGEGATPDVDVRDVATVLAAVASQGSHVGETLTVTGPEAVTAADMARAIGEQMGHPVDYVDCDEHDFIRAQTAGGLSRWKAEDRAAWQRAVQGGWLVRTDGDGARDHRSPRTRPRGVRRGVRGGRALCPLPLAARSQRHRLRLGRERRPAAPRDRGSAGSAAAARRSRGSPRSHRRTTAASRAPG